MRLLADIGGTNVRFALLPAGANRPERETNLVCADFDGLEQAARHYLSLVGSPAVSEAAIDVATAVTGDFVKLTVADTGRGMSPETLARMFEPYFTTKGPKLGTGLGLSIVQRLVKEANGALQVQSAVGAGTTWP